jgi:hypothetical protein
MGYFSWLCEQVCSDNEYIDLLSILDEYDYIWYLMLDENRAKGGILLRERYAKEAGVYIQDVRTGSCTFLEMLIGLSELMSDQIDGSEPYECFWMLIDNLGLRNVGLNRAHTIIKNFLSNNYSNTRGGLFPLKNYYGDIRGLDLYSQMNAWIECTFPHENIF